MTETVDIVCRVILKLHSVSEAGSASLFRWKINGKTLVTWSVINREPQHVSYRAYQSRHFPVLPEDGSRSRLRNVVGF